MTFTIQTDMSIPGIRLFHEKKILTVHQFFFKFPPSMTDLAVHEVKKEPPPFQSVLGAV